MPPSTRTASTSSRPEFQIVDAEKERTPRAKAYGKKVATLLNSLVHYFGEKEDAAPDAAAIIIHGPDIAKAWGDLADKDERVRKAIDFVSSSSENPYIAAVAATMPLLLQVVRNHENVKVEKPVRFSLFRRQISFNMKWRLRLNPFGRSITSPPELMTQHVFTQPDIVTHLREQGMELSWIDKYLRGSQNGRNS